MSSSSFGFKPANRSCGFNPATRSCGLKPAKISFCSEGFNPATHCCGFNPANRSCGVSPANQISPNYLPISVTSSGVKFIFMLDSPFKKTDQIFLKPAINHFNSSLLDSAMRDFWSPKFILDLNFIKIREALLSLMPSGKKSRCAAVHCLDCRLSNKISASGGSVITLTLGDTSILRGERTSSSNLANRRCHEVFCFLTISDFIKFHLS